MSSEDPKVKHGADKGAGAPAAKRDAPVKREAPVTNNNTGRVKFDDRGNAVWEWAVGTGAYATDISTSRLKKLDNLTLSIAEDTPPPPSKIVKENPRAWSKGTARTTAACWRRRNRRARKICGGCPSG